MSREDVSLWTHVLVTGSRKYPDPDLVPATLNNVVSYRDAIVLVHGAHGYGPDFWAHTWAENMPDTRVREKQFPVTQPAWDDYGYSAGPRRNQRMVDFLAGARARGAEVQCLAFLSACVSPRCRRTDPHESHGTSGCADMAEAAGIPTNRIRPRPHPSLEIPS